MKKVTNFPWLAGALAMGLAGAAELAYADEVREIEIVVDGAYRPDRVSVRVGERVGGWARGGRCAPRRLPL